MSQRYRFENLFVLIIVCVQLIASGCTLKPEDKFESKPIYQTIPAIIGVSVKNSFRLSNYKHTLVDVEFGESSVALFLQVFESMFKNITELPKWPPWKTYKHDQDAIIELDSSQIDLTIGDNLINPDVVTVLYTVCLYKPDGEQIKCWTTQATKSHQRILVEYTLVSSSIKPIVEGAMRASIADFMKSFENDQAVQKWQSSL